MRPCLKKQIIGLCSKILSQKKEEEEEKEEVGAGRQQKEGVGKGSYNLLKMAGQIDVDPDHCFGKKDIVL